MKSSSRLTRERTIIHVPGSFRGRVQIMWPTLPGPYGTVIIRKTILSRRWSCSFAAFWKGLNTGQEPSSEPWPDTSLWASVTRDLNNSNKNSSRLLAPGTNMEIYTSYISIFFCFFNFSSAQNIQIFNHFGAFNHLNANLKTWTHCYLYKIMWFFKYNK